MIVRLRDAQGSMRATDYARDGEDWQEAATRLYNTFLRYPGKPLRAIVSVRVLPFTYHANAYRVTMSYQIAASVTMFDDPVTVLVEESVHQPGSAGTRKLSERDRISHDPGATRPATRAVSRRLTTPHTGDTDPLPPLPHRKTGA